jgi:hypothetical protein
MSSNDNSLRLEVFPGGVDSQRWTACRGLTVVDHEDQRSSEPMKTSGDVFSHRKEMRGTPNALFVARGIA